MQSARRFPIGASVSIDELESDPHELLAELRAHEPVSWLPALDCWLVTRRDLVQQVMRDPAGFTVDDQRFSTAQVVGPSMLSLDGAEHDRHREPFVARFRPAEVAEQLAPTVGAIARRLVTALTARARGASGRSPRGAGGAPAAGGRAATELRRELAGPLAVEIILAALGLDAVPPASLLAWYDDIVAGVQAITAGAPAGAAAEAAAGELAGAVARSVATDPSSVIGRAAAAGLNSDELASNVAVTMFGAVETTEGMIANAALHLIERPELLEDVRRERGLVAAVTEESLRFEPAAAVVDRYSRADVELGGARIARGELVRLSLTAANRVPAVFEEPDRFDARRANARLHLAFAAGPHGCLGAALARAETAAALEALLELPGLALDPERPSAARGLVFRKPPALHVVFGPGAGPPL